MDRQTLTFLEQSDPRHARAALLARLLADSAVRNSQLENLHAGRNPADGRGSTRKTTVRCGKKEIPWDEVSRISEREMHTLMVEIESQLTSLLRVIHDWEQEDRLPQMLSLIREQYFGPGGVSWDIPPEVYWERRRLAAELRRGDKGRTAENGSGAGALPEG